MTTNDVSRTSEGYVLAALDRDASRSESPFAAAARQRIRPLAAVAGATGLTLAVVAAVAPMMLIGVGVVVMGVAIWAALLVGDHDGRTGLQQLRRGFHLLLRRLRPRRITRTVFGTRRA